MEAEPTSKRTILRTIEEECGERNASFRILHGVRENTIGRDVDVWVSGKERKIVDEAVRTASVKLGLDMVRIHSLFGNRYLFFSRDSSECGMFEFHCVRSLRWFWVGNPVVEESASAWKRLVLPLLAGDLEKVEREATEQPLSEMEKDYLRDNFRRRCFLSNRQVVEVYRMIENRNYAEASSALRHAILVKFWRHPVGLFAYLANRIIAPFWLFLKPCGPLGYAFEKDTAKEGFNCLSERKGILTRVDFHDVSDMSMISLLVRIPGFRIRQGRQAASVFLLRPGQRWILSFFSRPVAVDKPCDFPRACARAMIQMIAGT